MKKVLALVLAVIMVCTMAMALTVGGEPVSNPSTKETGVAVNPGTVIAITQTDLETWGINFLKNDANKLVPEVKNAEGKVLYKTTVKVSFGQGAGLVASEGWVETNAGWEYQIALKENDTAKLDEKVDLSIAQISYKITGDINAQVVKFDNADKTENTADDKILFDVGYEVVEMGLDKDGVLDIDAKLTADIFKEWVRGAIVKVTKGDSKATSGKVVVSGPRHIGEIAVNVGDEFLVTSDKAVAYDWTDKESDKMTGDINGYNPTSKKITVKIGTYDLLDWNDDTAVYAKDYRTGKLVKLAVTVDDGVASFTVPAFSLVASVNGVLAGATSEAGTGTTNPGTGANDVVGVAAALAVVALVSGAAISLKK